MEQVLSAELGLPRAAALISTSSLHSLPWDNEITAAPRENPAPGRRHSLLHAKERTSKSLSGPNMGQPDKDYVSHLNEQNNTRKPLTSGIVLHRITRQLQCNYRLTEFEQWVYTVCGFKAH